MVDLRFVERDGKRILQWRRVDFWETLIDGQFVAALEMTSFPRKPKWSDWADVPTHAEGAKND